VGISDLIIDKRASLDVDALRWKTLADQFGQSICFSPLGEIGVDRDISRKELLQFMLRMPGVDI
jgi:hypothetical protein